MRERWHQWWTSSRGVLHSLWCPAKHPDRGEGLSWGMVGPRVRALGTGDAADLLVHPSSSCHGFTGCWAEAVLCPQRKSAHCFTLRPYICTGPFGNVLSIQYPSCKSAHLHSPSSLVSRFNVLIEVGWIISKVAMEHIQKSGISLHYSRNQHEALHSLQTS